MKKLVAPLLVSMMAAVAFAGLDPNADSFGIYFDTLGNTNHSSPMTAVTKNVYVLMMNPSTGIKGFEFAYEIVPHPLMAPTFVDDFTRLSSVIAGTGFLDIGVSSDPAVGDYRVAYAAPRPAVPEMLMVTWRFRYYGEADLGMEFFLTGVKTNASMPGGLPVVLNDAGLKRQAFLASGDPLLPCAGTVDNAPVAEVLNSFGSVKSLFR